MNFEYTEKVEGLRTQVSNFMQEHVYPLEKEVYEHCEGADTQWQAIPQMEDLKAKAKEQGLWNLFLPEDYGELSPGLTNLEYAPLAEIMGKIMWAPEIFNCGAPDTGNMEVLAKYGTPEQQKEWLVPLMDGTIRSAFLMTEPRVASSDATNHQWATEEAGRFSR